MPEEGVPGMSRSAIPEQVDIIPPAEETPPPAPDAAEPAVVADPNALPSNSQPDETTPPSLPASPPQETPPSEESTNDDLTIQAAENALAQAGLDLNVYMDEFTQNGELSESSVTDLVAAGFPKPVIDAFVAGRQALIDQSEGNIRDIAHGITGGEEQYQSLTSWANSNLSEAEVAHYNQEVQSGDAIRTESAVRGLTQKYQEVNGSEGTLFHGGSAAAASDIYQDRSQMMEDMNDPRYKESEAYRANVAAKTQRTMQQRGSSFS